MRGAHYRLFEVTQLLQGDVVGNALIDDVLTACFDYTIADQDALGTLVQALDRVNCHLEGECSAARPLFHGTPAEVSVWAAELTDEIYTNSAGL